MHNKIERSSEGSREFERLIADGYSEREREREREREQSKSTPQKDKCRRQREEGRKKLGLVSGKAD